MNKAQFKKAFSLYRKHLSTVGETAYTKRFDQLFKNTGKMIAFCNSGCSYSFPFAWIYGKRGSYRAERVVDRNVTKGVINA